MKHLYFIRHGETDANKHNIWSDHNTPLNEQGHNQAKITAKKLKQANIKIGLIITSTMPRAIDTARHIAEAIEYPLKSIVQDPEAKERYCGILDGIKDEAASKLWAIDESLVDTYENVESLADFQKRVDKFLMNLKKRPEDTILIVGHGAFARALRRSINGDPISVHGQSLKNGELVKFI